MLRWVIGEDILYPGHTNRLLVNCNTHQRILNVIFHPQKFLFPLIYFNLTKTLGKSIMAAVSK